MKTGILAAITAVLLTGAASAGDIYKRDSIKDETKDMKFAETAELVNWSGLYIGGQVGYGKAQHDVEVRSYGDAKPYSSGGDGTLFGTLGLDGIGGDGFIGGGRIGYDHTFGSFLIGIFGEYNFSNLETTLSLSGGGSGAEFALEKENDWSVGGRLGMIVAPRTMVYVLGAYTEGDFAITGPGVSASDDFDPERTLKGWTAGGGVEYALTNGVFLGLEGSYTIYDKETWYDGRNSKGNGEVIEAETDELKVMGTAKIKLNGNVMNLK